MISRRIIILAATLILVLVGLFFTIFEQKEIPDVQWHVDYSFESKEPHGAWLLAELLKEAYGEDKVVKLDAENYIPDHSNDNRKGYLLISDFVAFDKHKVDELASFVNKGNDAVLIISDHGNQLDSLFENYFTYFSIKDTTATLTIPNDTTAYDLSYYYLNFDTASTNYYHAFDTIYEDSMKDVHILSYLNDSLATFLQFEYGAGQFYIHSIPDAFSNIGIKQKSMEGYATNVLPLLDIDTLYLDHAYYNRNYRIDESPLQFVMSQSSLRWAYYTMLFGLVLFAISRGKRRQRIIPVLEQNENTSLEYIHTLSELYRSQYQHHKLAKHLKIIFHQWIKKKYFLKPDDPQYTLKIAHKSKVAPEEIERLLNRLDAAVGNRRFDDLQLSNLYNDLNQFYKKCN